MNFLLQMFYCRQKNHSQESRGLSCVHSAGKASDIPSACRGIFYDLFHTDRLIREK